VCECVCVCVCTETSRPLFSYVDKQYLSTRNLLFVVRVLLRSVTPNIEAELNPIRVSDLTWFHEVCV
jgi:hypothetical protein